MSSLPCRFLILFGMLAAAVGAHAQRVQLTDWRTITSMRTVVGADIDARNRVWAATTGGLFVHSMADGTTRQFRNIGALQSLSCTAVYCDSAAGYTYIGGIDGALDIASEDFSFTSVSDIKRASQYQRRAIRDFANRGDTLLMATDFGVVTFDKRRKVFIETIDRIGTMEEKTPVNSITIYRDSVWLATDAGMAVAPLNVTTLRNPGVWHIIDSTHGLPAKKISHIEHTSAGIMVGCGKSVLQWNDTGFVQRYASTLYPINGLSVVNGVLYISVLDGVRTLDGSLGAVWPGPVLGHSTVVVHGVPHVLAFIENRSLTILKDNELTSVEVNSPLSNQFAHMNFDRNGGLWVATDVDPPNAGVGFSYYDGTTWENIHESNTPTLPSRNIFRVSPLADGSMLLSTWGKGALRATADGDGVHFQTLNGSNSDLTGILADANYIVAGEAASDRNGNTYIVNEQSANRVLVRQATDGTWQHFTNCTDARSNLYRSLALDPAGNAWMASPHGFGVLAYSIRNTPDDPTDDVCQAIRSSNTQLPDNTVSVVRADNTGSIWVGTARGVAVIAAPTSVSNTTIPFVRRITALSSPVVNDIFVDALNYKWIATTSGVFVLNEDGTEVLATITTSTTPLVSDNVRTIAVNDIDGTVYFGTAEGCTSARTQSIRPIAAYDITVRPHPFRPLEDGSVVIDGLVVDSDIRILTTNGHMVAAMQSRGRQALWDGRDTRGELVPPGVYVIHTASTSTKESSVGKIVVTR